ncbi:hypothetical protein BDR03DRAFT_956246 [Suillus americanus]|nr:hypothetical protein BDR03DRAFT_956246 [Suillus americanus]
MPSQELARQGIRLLKEKIVKPSHQMLNRLKASELGGNPTRTNLYTSQSIMIQHSVYFLKLRCQA